MKKSLMDKLIKEVGDLGDRMYTGVSNMAGGSVVNTGYPTPSSPDNSQNPGNFKYTPTIAGSATNINVSTPPEDPETPPEFQDLETTKKSIDAVKYKVTPDEIITGINAELKRMVFKRPDVAKTLVLNNLKKDPKYYSKLHFLDINDTMDESLNNKTPQEIAIIKIVRELAEKKKRKI